MATINKHGRQDMLWGLVDALASDLVAGNTFTTNLPPNTLLDTITVDVTTLFNGTTPTVTVSDGTTSFVAAAAITAAGRIAVTGIGKLYPNGGTITTSFGGSGSTAGELVAAIGYLVVGRATEIQA